MNGFCILFIIHFQLIIKVQERKGVARSVRVNAMKTVIIVLIFVALGSNIVAHMTIEGSMISKVNTYKLLRIALGISMIQGVVLLLGSKLIDYLITLPIIDSWNSHHMVATIILLIMGCRCIYNSFFSEEIDERRQKDLDDTKLVRYALLRSVNAFLAGVVLSLLEIKFTKIFWVLILINVISVICGILIGYWYGYVEKEKGYRISGIIYLTISTNLLINII